MIGTVLFDATGRSYRVLRKLGEGGQGVAYAVEDERTRAEVVAKINHPKASTPVDVARLDALCDLALSTRSAALCAPMSRLRDRHGVGSIQRMARGVALATLYENPTYTLQQGLMIAAALTRAVATLEAAGLAHGDLSSNNILVHWNGTFFESNLIDFENAVIPGAPAPTFLGQEPFLAPELAITGGAPTLESDRFALAVVLHQLLYLRHPFAAVPAANQDPSSYVEFLKTATWVEDPMAARVVAQTEGRPVGVLSRDLQALFRSALEVDPARRPAAERWTKLLERALYHLFACDSCGQGCVNEKTRVRCPWCGASVPSFAFHINGRLVPIVGTYTTIGRAKIGGDEKISREHLRFEREGFALRVRCLSANGAAVQTDEGWVELKEGEELGVSPGMWLRITKGVEGLVCESPHAANGP